MCEYARIKLYDFTVMESEEKREEETGTQCASIEHVPRLVSLLIAQSLNVRCRCYGRGAAVEESERKHERSRNCLEGCPRTRN